MKKLVTEQLRGIFHLFDHASMQMDKVPVSRVWYIVPLCDIIKQKKIAVQELETERLSNQNRGESHGIF